LEERGFVRLHRVVGPPHPYSQTVTLLGFDKFANARIPKFQDIVRTVGRHVIDREYVENGEISKALGLPIRIVSHVFELLETKNWIALTREIGGGYESLTVDTISPTFKRKMEGR